MSLSPKWESLIKEKVKSGRYNSASEVVRESLRLLEERDSVEEMKLAQLKKEIQIGMEGGPATPLDMDEIKRTARKKWDAQQELNE